MSIKANDVVRYKQDFWVVLNTKYAGGGLRIMRPHVGNEKREIHSNKAEPTGHTVTAINYKGKDVLVTRRGFLISMVSERLLKNTTRDGKAMLRMAANGQIAFDPDTRSGSTPYQDFDDGQLAIDNAVARLANS